MKTYKPTKELLEFANEIADYLPKTKNRSCRISMVSDKERYKINIYGRIPETTTPARVNCKTAEVDLSRQRINECKSHRDKDGKCLTMFLIFWCDCMTKLEKNYAKQSIDADRLVIEYMLKKGYSKYNIFVGVTKMLQTNAYETTRQRIINTK